MGMNENRALATLVQDPQRSIARAAVAHGLARMDRSKSAEQHAKERWPFDEDAHLITRAATVPLDMTNTAALVQVALATLPMLQPFSAAAQLFERGLTVALTRESGAFTVPNLGLVQVAFVADGKPKPVVQGASTGARIDPHKIAGITVVSSELFAQPSIEPVMQRMLSESTGPALDAVVFSNQAGSAAHPPGLLNGIAGLTPTAAAGNKTDIFLSDLQALVAAIGPVAGASPVVFIMNPAQAISMQYRSFLNVTPIMLTSSYVAMGTIIAVAVNAVVSAMGVPTFETNTQATLSMNDTATAWPGGPVASMFQTASVAIKMILDVSWALRSTQGVAWMAGVNW